MTIALCSKRHATNGNIVICAQLFDFPDLFVETLLVKVNLHAVSSSTSIWSLTIHWFDTNGGFKQQLIDSVPLCFKK